MRAPRLSWPSRPLPLWEGRGIGKVDGDPLMEQLEDLRNLEFLVKERALFDLESNVGAP